LTPNSKADKGITDEFDQYLKDKGSVVPNIGMPV
jgi:hypothetical protein